jgi:hypothetical protein
MRLESPSKARRKVGPTSPPRSNRESSRAGSVPLRCEEWQPAGQKLRSKTIPAETHSRRWLKVWVHLISSCFVPGILVRFVLPRSAGNKKPPTCIRRAVGVSNWRSLVYQLRRVHIGGSFSTSMAPWHLHSQVAASFSRQLLMLIARYQAAAKQSTEDVEVSPSPAEPNTFGSR